MSGAEGEILRLPSGQEIGYAVYGDPDGYPVLAFHGTPASRLMYRKGDHAARKLGLKLIAPDRPGYGLSPRDVTPTLASRTDQHEAIVDALGLADFAVIGISGGAPYATALASRLGSRVHALALVSPMGPVADYVAAGNAKLPVLQRRFFLKLSQRTWLVRPGAALAVAAFRAAPRAFASAFKSSLGSADARVLAEKSVIDSLIDMTEEAVRSGAGGAVADFEIFGQPWTVAYSEISAPATVWAGTADRVVPIPVCRYLADCIPQARLVVLPGAAHFWILEHAHEVLTEVRAMLDAAKPQGAPPVEARNGRLMS